MFSGDRFPFDSHEDFRRQLRPSARPLSGPRLRSTPQSATSATTLPFRCAPYAIIYLVQLRGVTLGVQLITPTSNSNFPLPLPLPLQLPTPTLNWNYHGTGHQWLQQRLQQIRGLRREVQERRQGEDDCAPRVTAGGRNHPAFRV